MDAGNADGAEVDVVVGVGEALRVEDGSGAAHPASRAQSRAAAIVFIVKETVRVPDWLRKDHPKLASRHCGQCTRSGDSDCFFRAPE